MKKNLITVLILALVLVNLVLTAILTIAILPETRKANALITQVATAIDLELSSGETQSETQDIPIDSIAMYDVAAGETMTINLKKSEDGKNHYALIAVSLSLNMENEDYETYAESLTTRESFIKSEVNQIVSQYTYDEFTSNQQMVQEAILTALQEAFQSEFIIAVKFPSVVAE